VSATPTREELAAIVAAIVAVADAAAPRLEASHVEAQLAPWAHAMRRSDLEMDDLRLLAQMPKAAACSTRF
jgi:hypothetical protein